jgi:ribonucleotide monophosphatase NagD (HAD superfamily)
MTQTNLSSDWIARLTWPGHEGAVVLGRDLQFRVEGEDPLGALALQANLAGIHADRYVPTPDKGYPGRGLAALVAKALGAKVEFAPPPPFDPKVVY